MTRCWWLGHRWQFDPILGAGFVICSFCHADAENESPYKIRGPAILERLRGPYYWWMDEALPTLLRPYTYIWALIRKWRHD